MVKFKIIENKSIYKDKQNSNISKYESISLVDILEDEENKILVSNYDPRERAVAIFEVNLKNNSLKKLNHRSLILMATEYQFHRFRGQDSICRFL